MQLIIGAWTRSATPRFNRALFAAAVAIPHHCRCNEQWRTTSKLQEPWLCPGHKILRDNYWEVRARRSAKKIHKAAHSEGCGQHLVRFMEGFKDHYKELTMQHVQWYHFRYDARLPTYGCLMSVGSFTGQCRSSLGCSMVRQKSIAGTQMGLIHLCHFTNIWYRTRQACHDPQLVVSLQTADTERHRDDTNYYSASSWPCFSPCPMALTTLYIASFQSLQGLASCIIVRVASLRLQLGAAIGETASPACALVVTIV